jgi:FMN phosphatase YigB (HAD superfamily)
MISGVIFDFDNTIYDYDVCNKKSLLKVFTHIEENFKKDIVKEVYDKINIEIKQSNNYCNKFNKNIYFKRLLENFNIPINELDNIMLSDESVSDQSVNQDNVMDEIRALKDEKNLSIRKVIILLSDIVNILSLSDLNEILTESPIKALLKYMKSQRV